MKAKDGSVTQQIKPIAGKAAETTKAVKTYLLSKPYTRRQKFGLGFRVGILAIIAGIFLGRRMRSGS